MSHANEFNLKTRKKNPLILFCDDIKMKSIKKNVSKQNEVSFSSGGVILTFFCFFRILFSDYGDVFSETSCSSVFLLIYFTAVVAKQFAYGAKSHVKIQNVSKQSSHRGDEINKSI